MDQVIAYVTYLVRDYDEAIAYFRTALGFRLVEDTPMGEGKRWVRVAPQGNGGPSLLLAQAVTPQQAACVGRQAGGRVFLFLHADDFARDHARMKAAGVTFLMAPVAEFSVIDWYGLMGAPRNVIIDKKGIVRFRHEGYEDGDEARYAEVVEQLLAE